MNELQKLPLGLETIWQDFLKDRITFSHFCQSAFEGLDNREYSRSETAFTLYSALLLLEKNGGLSPELATIKRQMAALRDGQVWDQQLWREVRIALESYLKM